MNLSMEQKETSQISLSEIQGKRKKFFDKKNILIGSAVLLLLVSIVGGSLYVKSSSSMSTRGAERSASENTPLASNTIPTPTPTAIPVIYRNPLNGVVMEESALKSLEHRPLAIMIDNSEPARIVQENVNRADIVYEAIVEGGWTRFMGIYYSDQSNFRVMPVRSVRMVFLDNITEYNDIMFYHVGGAYTPAEPKTNAIQRILDEKLKSIFFYKGNMNTTFNELYDEACFKKGVVGYSCKYHFTKTLYDKAKAVGYEDQKWEPDYKFDWMWKYQDTPIETGKDATSIKYKFTPNRGFDADWTYDASSNKYTRKIDKKALIDHATKENVWTNTIIVQKIKYKLNVDDKLRSIAYTDGTGDATIFMNGKAYEVTWKKDDSTGKRTRYYDKETGKEFTFNPGKIWVSVTRDVEEVSYQ